MEYKEEILCKESNFEYTFLISDSSVKICSSYFPGQLKKKNFDFLKILQWFNPLILRNCN